MPDNRDIVASFIERLDAGDVEGAFELMADDGRWIAPGKATVGKNTARHAMEQTHRRFRASLPEGLRLKATGWTVQGDRVAVETMAEAKRQDGETTTNPGHFLFELEDGKIRTVKEYSNTTQAWEAFATAALATG